MNPGAAEPVTDATHLADDVVLLADVAELTDPRAVVRAAQAAGVDAIHPGGGPLAGDAALAAEAEAAGLVAVVTRGLPAAGEIAAALRRHGLPAPDACSRTPDRWVYVLVAGHRLDVLGTVHADGRDRVVAGDDDPGADADHRLARAVSAVLGVDGLAAVGLVAGEVGAVLPGLPIGHAVWELVSGVDLVEWQLAAATGTLDPVGEVSMHGAAVGLARPAVLADPRRLAPEPGLRVDAVALAGAGHGELVRLSAWGADRLAAAARLDRITATLQLAPCAESRSRSDTPVSPASE